MTGDECDPDGGTVCYQSIPRSGQNGSKKIECGLGEETACYCLLSDVMDLLGRKYAMDVVCVIAVHGTARFGDLEGHIPNASTSTLSTRLDELEGAGLLRRERFDEIPPRVEYGLTEEGEALGERLRPLIEWAAERV